MENQALLAALVGPLLLILGLSLLLYTDVWRKLAGEWEKNHFTLYSIMVVNILFGLLIINTHNVWELTPYVAITLVGWVGFLKAAAYFLLPGKSYVDMCKSLNNKSIYQLSGLVAAVLGGWLSYLVYLV